ncbi:MAG: four-carbon acid sugar kinase family protein, partial [Planctomycetota bacterium]
MVVVADDLSGAAEIAGIARGFGLSVEVQLDAFRQTKLEVPERPEIEVTVVDADTRSRPVAEAAEAMRALARSIDAAGPEFVFQKVDSLLRGSIAAESRELALGLGRSGVLLANANPRKGRTVKGGRLFVDGAPIDRTDFAYDPEFPAPVADVRELLLRRDAAGASPTDLVAADASRTDDLIALAATA